MTLLLTLLFACRGGSPCTEVSCDGNVARTCDNLGNRKEITCEGDNPACVVAGDQASCVTADDATCTVDDAASCEGDTRFQCDTAIGYVVAYDCAADGKICTDESEDRGFRCVEP